MLLPIKQRRQALRHDGPQELGPFLGSDSCDGRAAEIYTQVETCKLNDLDSHGWLADAFRRLLAHPAKRIHG